MGNFAPIPFNTTWLRRLEPAARAELSALERESDPQLYAEGVLGLAQRQEQSGRPDLAVDFYQSLLQSEGVEAPQRLRAQRRLEALTGGGAFGNRAEVLLRNLAQEASDPTMLLAMGTAGAVFRMTRLATLSRLASASNPSFLTRLLGAGRLASLAGFALEAPTFTLTGRLAGEAVGRSQDWSLRGVGRDLVSSYLVLGGLKLSGTLGEAAVARTGASPTTAALFRQGSMLSGILFGHRLEQWAGLRRPQDGATTLVDSLALLLQFHVAGRLSGAAFGENFQRWEQGMDLRADALSQSVVAARPHLALVTAGGLDLKLPQVFAMSSNENESGTKLGAPSGESTPMPVERMPPVPADPIGDFRRVTVPRTWVREGLGDGSQVWGYDLILEDLEGLLQIGASRVIARRNGQDMVLKLIDSNVSSETNPYVPPGLQDYHFLIQEGEHLGKLTLYLEPGQLHLFSIQNHEGTQNRPELLPGAGTMVIDWLATQASLRGERFHILGIQNPRIFHILTQRPFFHPQFNLVEACRFQGLGHQVRGMAPLSDGKFRARHWGTGFFNIRGRPNPELLPTELRSLIADRSFGNSEASGEALHPYELKIDPFRNFLRPDFSGVIARREGRELRWKTDSVMAVDRAGEFLESGALIVKGKLQESEGGGEMTLYLHPDRLEVFSIVTKQLPPGAGTLALDWAATQAAVNRRAFGVLYIENARILRILARSGLMRSESQILEAYRHSHGFYTQPLGPLGAFPHLNFNPLADFLIIRGVPNSALLPRELLGLPKH